MIAVVHVRDFPKLGAQSAFQILERNAVPVAVLGKLRIKIRSEVANQPSRAHIVRLSYG